MSKGELTISTNLEWRYGQNATQEYFDARIGRARFSVIRNKNEGRWFALKSEDERIYLLSSAFYRDVNDLILYVEQQLQKEENKTQQLQKQTS